jgi:hypothetical protein
MRHAPDSTAPVEAIPGAKRERIRIRFRPEKTQADLRKFEFGKAENVAQTHEDHLHARTGLNLSRLGQVQRHRLFEAMKKEFVESHPDATPREYETAIAAFARRMRI